jgi:hypothetical protein
MMKDIVPNASMPAIAEAMKRGWLAITRSGRGGTAISAWLGVEAAGVTDVKRHRQIVRHAHEAGPDHGGGDAAGGHP